MAGDHFELTNVLYCCQIKYSEFLVWRTLQHYSLTVGSSQVPINCITIKSKVQLVYVSRETNLKTCTV